jgi:hypothetical protein
VIWGNISQNKVNQLAYYVKLELFVIKLAVKVAIIVLLAKKLHIMVQKIVHCKLNYFKLTLN